MRTTTAPPTASLSLRQGEFAMHLRKCLITSAAIFSVAASMTSAANAVSVAVPIVSGEPIEGSPGRLQLVHARNDRHCHNMPRRTYCHKSERLPRNWPPNTNTPGSSRKPCWVDSRNCLFSGIHSHKQKVR